MSRTFTTLRHPVEKLLEAEHFLSRLTTANGIVFQFEINAFLSACRSVTFLMQAAFSEVPGFAEWYEQRRAEMSADAAMRFFLKLRNLSQKAGPVSYVGGSRRGGGWTYRFVHGAEHVPDTLRARDIGACCAEQLGKLAGLVLACADAFPFHACPVAAFSAEGMKRLGYMMEDAEKAMGLPAGYIDVAGFDVEAKLRLLKRELEPLDRAALNRMAAGDFRDGDERLMFLESGGANMIDDVAALVDTKNPGAIEIRTMFLQAIAARIGQSDSDC